jgi:hypothetical protein
MTRDEVIRYYRDRLEEAQKELDDFEACVAKYNLRILHRTTRPGNVERLYAGARSLCSRRSGTQCQWK